MLVIIQSTALFKTPPPKPKPDPKPVNPTTMCSVEKRGHVFILTLTGGVEHRLSPAAIASIRSALARIRSESLASLAPSALVTCAAGDRFFSNGFDLAFANSAPTSSARADRLHSMVAAFVPLVGDLMSLPMPTVAAVTGHAAGAGVPLALAHDYVVMRGDRAVLCLPELDLGLPFPPYFLSIMREKVRDPRVSKGLVMSSKKIAAAEAAEGGVVDLVKGSTGETVEAAVAMAEGFLKRKWKGETYASVRMGSFPGICKAVGLKEESDEDRHRMTASRL